MFSLTLLSVHNSFTFLRTSKIFNKAGLIRAYCVQERFALESEKRVDHNQVYYFSSTTVNRLVFSLTLLSVHNSFTFLRTSKIFNKASLIRAYGVQERFALESEKRVDHNQVYYFSSTTVNRLVFSLTLLSVHNSFTFLRTSKIFNKASLIRAYGVQERFAPESEKRVDHNQVYYFSSTTVNRLVFSLKSLSLHIFPPIFALLKSSTRPVWSRPMVYGTYLLSIQRNKMIITKNTIFHLQLSIG